MNSLLAQAKQNQRIKQCADVVEHVAGRASFCLGCTRALLVMGVMVFGSVGQLAIQSNLEVEARPLSGESNCYVLMSTPGSLPEGFEFSQSATIDGGVSASASVALVGSAEESYDNDMCSIDESCIVQNKAGNGNHEHYWVENITDPADTEAGGPSTTVLANRWVFPFFWGVAKLLTLPVDGQRTLMDLALGLEAGRFLAFIKELTIPASPEVLSKFPKTLEVAGHIYHHVRFQSNPNQILQSLTSMRRHPECRFSGPGSTYPGLELYITDVSLDKGDAAFLFNWVTYDCGITMLMAFVLIAGRCCSCRSTSDSTDNQDTREPKSENTDNTENADSGSSSCEATFEFYGRVIWFLIRWGMLLMVVVSGLLSLAISPFAIIWTWSWSAFWSFSVSFAIDFFQILLGLNSLLETMATLIKIANTVRNYAASGDEDKPPCVTPAQDLGKSQGEV
jgi:hypothetical protein